MSDLEKVSNGLCEAIGVIHGYVPKQYWGYGEQACRDAIDMLRGQGTGWKPFIKRELTPDEATLHPEWCYILEGDTPDDEQEIILYRPWRNKQGYIVELDTFMNNGCECYLEGAGDIENGMYWMPLPEPPEVT